MSEEAGENASTVSFFHDDTQEADAVNGPPLFSLVVWCVLFFFLPLRPAFSFCVCESIFFLKPVLGSFSIF